MTFNDLCTYPGCINLKLSNFDYCINHIPEKEKIQEAIEREITMKPSLSESRANGLFVDTRSWARKKFTCCTFLNSQFKNVDFSEAKLRMCIFDFSTFRW